MTLISLTLCICMKSLRLAKSRLPEINDELLFRIYRAVVESKMLYGIEIWGEEQSWKFVDAMRARYCKISLNLPVSTCEDAAWCEMGVEGSNGLIPTRIIKYYNYITRKGDNELLR